MEELNSTSDEENEPETNVAGKEINPNSSKEVQKDEKNGV